MVKLVEIWLRIFSVPHRVCLDFSKYKGILYLCGLRVSEINIVWRIMFRISKFSWSFLYFMIILIYLYCLIYPLQYFLQFVYVFIPYFLINPVEQEKSGWQHVSYTIVSNNNAYISLDTQIDPVLSLCVILPSSMIWFSAKVCYNRDKKFEIKSYKYYYI